MPINEESLNRLHNACQKNNFTLYLGAGVSIGNGLPTWERLVLAMYFSAISRQSMGQWRPFPNYLFAIAEWFMERSHEPLEITARKIQKYYQNRDDFVEHLRKTLYAGFTLSDSTQFQPVDTMDLRSANPTLNALSKLCESSRIGSKGVRAVITYNYDGLLETSLGNFPYQSIWKSEPLKSGKLPIYHVHGYVPLRENKGSTAEEIVFTEDQYHQAAQNAYSWANLVQIQYMSSSVGLMIGLSLSDRNMRRLLDAIRKIPSHTENYALMQEPQWLQPSDEELNKIQTKAMMYFDRFKKSGVKGSGGDEPGVKGPTWERQVCEIIKEVQRLSVEQQTFVLEQLGVCPIWYKEHNEIPDIINKIISTL